MNPAQIEQTDTKIQQNKIIQSRPSHLLALSLVILGVIALSVLVTYYYVKPQLSVSSYVQLQRNQEEDRSSEDNTKNNTTMKGVTQGMEDWKTYINKTYHFSVKYPPTLHTSSNGDFGVDFVITNANEKLISPNDIKVRVGINQSTRNFISLYDAKNDAIIASEQHAQGAIFTKVTNTIIGQNKAIEYTYEVPGNQTETSYTYGVIINKDNNLIEMRTLGNTKAEADDQKVIFDQIISTFENTK